MEYIFVARYSVNLTTCEWLNLSNEIGGTPHRTVALIIHSPVWDRT